MLGPIVLVLVAGSAGAAAPDPADSSATPRAIVSCQETAGHRQCLRRCTPANLMLLPCMAVGATAMPTCREREVARCVETCRRKFC